MIAPDINCKICDRLYCFRLENKAKFPEYNNTPVESFGSLDAEVLIVGLAPGLHGANNTGRPFTNDYAGDVLYPILKEYNFASGVYNKTKDDGYVLDNVRVTNAVRCVPPQNKPINIEEKNCNKFLVEEIKAMKNLKVILCLGGISHKNTLIALGQKQSLYKFKHGEIHDFPTIKIKIVDSYHTSKYNISTKVLTYDMFREIIKIIRGLI